MKSATLRDVFPMSRREIDARAVGTWLIPAGTPIWVDGLPLYPEELVAGVLRLRACVDAVRVALGSLDDPPQC